jgi:diguanylate cyclase (GGDEF)-like protein
MATTSFIGVSIGGSAREYDAPTGNPATCLESEASMDRPIDLLAKSADALAASDDLDVTVARLLDLATGELGATFGAVTLQDSDRVQLQVAVTLGADEAGRAAFEADVSTTGSDVASTAADRMPRMAKGLAHLPLVVVRGGIEQVVGVLSLSWPDETAPTDEQRAILGAFAGLIAVAIDRARLSSLVAERAEWFERVAHTDPLTGLANERTFGRVLELELTRAGRQGGEVSLAIFDVDDFAATNADAGHAAGNQILRSVAAVLAESVRLVDTVARIGGDEFVLVAPGSAGATVARRVLDGIAALPETAGRRISVSVGVACFPTDGTTAEDLRAAALSALAAARVEGRGGLASAGRDQSAGKT